MQSYVVRVQIPGARDERRAARYTVDAVVEKMGLPRDVSAALRRAVGAACRCAASRGDQDGAAGPMTMECRVSPDNLEIDVTGAAVAQAVDAAAPEEGAGRPLLRLHRRRRDAVN